MASLPDGIPGYRLVRVLGQGGMATVYLAEQESLGRQVALKLLADRYAEDPEAAARFVREARTAARLVHRHIVGIHDVGSHGGRPYLAMEYLPGDTVPATRTDPAQALQVAREIALALDHAHREGVVHRDVKPENILRRADGSHALADFGIARTADAEAPMTRDGVTLGTPHYMSPEQLQGKPLDGRADLYSLGVVLHQLLTGNLPYQGTDGWSVGVQHISAPVPRLPATLARLQALVDRLMAKDPADRPQTGAEAAQLIEAAQAALTPGVSQPTMALPTSVASPRRAVVAVAAVALLGFLGWAGWQLASRGAGSKAAAAAATAAADRADRSIAVLPLANLSGKAENEYFSDGLAETMLDMLARSPDLRVIARSSSFAFKGKDVDVREIGRKLGAAHLLQGSVQQEGENVRIRAQLVRAADGEILWSQRFDRKLSDVFRIQDEVASEVVSALQGALPNADRQRVLARRTANLGAYREYLRGTALLRLRRVDDLREALEYFQRAIGMDAAYVDAHVGAAAALTLLHTHASLTAAEEAGRARLIARALELDPNSGEAMVMRAALLQATDAAASDRAYRKALELAPNYATGWQWYGEFLADDQGKVEAALPILERARRLDPLAPIIQVEVARLYYRLGRPDDAQRLSDRIVADFPSFPQGYAVRADLRMAHGDLAGALKAHDQGIAADPSSPRARLARCTMILDVGALQQAERCRAALADRDDIQQRAGDFDFLRLLVKGDQEAALHLAQTDPRAQPWQKAWSLRMAGKPAEAMEMYRRMWPQWLAQPLDQPAMSSPFDAIDVGATLLALGRREQGEAVLRYMLENARTLPRIGITGKGWADVYGHALLGEYPQACAALDAGVADSFISGHRLMLVDPDLAALRRQPCFAPAHARLAAAAQAQIDRAIAAGAL